MTDGHDRSSPLLPHALLWVGFLVVLAIGVVTVFIPEVQDDGADEEETSEPAAPAEEPESSPAAP